MQNSQIRATASYVAQKVRLLLPYHDQRLYRTCKNMPSVSIPWEVHKVTARTPTCYNELITINGLGYRYNRALRKGQSLRAHIYLDSNGLLLQIGRDPSPRLHNKNSEEFIRIYIIYRLSVPETIKNDNGQSFKSVALYKLYTKYQKKGTILHETMHLRMALQEFIVFGGGQKSPLKSYFLAKTKRPEKIATNRLLVAVRKNPPLEPRLLEAD